MAIGPYPAECLDLLLHTPGVQLVMGNHDAWFVNGLPEQRPAWMSDGELEHQRWTHAQMDPELRCVVARWPYVLQSEFLGVRAAFLHYKVAPSSCDFVPAVQNPTFRDLARLFPSGGAALLFFGHDHSPTDVEGLRVRYVNPGSLGCCDQALARYCVVDFRRGQYTIAHRAVPYDDGALFSTFEERRVPARRFIYHAFFGGRFGR